VKPQRRGLADTTLRDVTLKRSVSLAKSKQALAVVAFASVLGACSSGGDEASETGTEPGVTTSAAAPQTSAPASSAAAEETSAAPLSENEQFVQTFVDALDELGIEHSDPKRTEAAMLSKASYDITVNGFDAGINIFVDAESQQSWVEASDSLGGVCVVIDGAALSLNSSEGVEDSADIAPKIAERVGGEAHGN